MWPLSSSLLLVLLFTPPSSSTSSSQARDWATAKSLAHHLVQRMTEAEKANLTRGFSLTSNVCAGNSGSVPRLGFPGLCLHDAADGLRATDMVSAYPAGLHAGAAWDRGLAYHRALYMGREFRAKGGG